MSKKYILTVCLFWACSIASAQITLPAFQGVFGKKVVTGTVPSFPRSLVATSGYEEATVSFLAPTSNGGNVITGYTVTSSPGGFTASGAASPLTVSGLSNGTSYSFKVVATNALGNSAPSTSSSFITIFAIGTPYQGGKLAYLFISGNPGYVVGETHGLIAGISDQGIDKYWYVGSSHGYIVTGATGTAIGTGSSNTDKIITAQGAAATTYAAGIARAYRGGGYTDWYLPSKDELHNLYLNRVAIGGFFTQKYWSSSIEQNHVSRDLDFGTGLWNGDWNDSRYRVRAVRTF